MILMVRAGPVNVCEHHKRTRPLDGFFDRATNPMIAQRQDKRQQRNANNSTGSSFPNQNQRRDQQHRIKQGISADERHYGIKKRIGQLRVDEAKQVDVQLHEGSLKSKVESLKSQREEAGSINNQRADWVLLELLASP